ncbi:MAG: amidohydrolase [Synergistaceae bacterium]|nr:amidohydrolase [Synergistaceae bacterium]
MNKRDMFRYLDENKDVMTGVSDKIWDYAETAFEEFRSAALVKDVTLKHGFDVKSGIGGIDTAFCAAFGTGAPVIGILAEYDALSGLSQEAGSTERREATVGGCGHGCGHNLFAGASVGAAIAVKEYMADNRLPGTVKLFGCPGEEGGSGKAFMARAGAFNDLDAAFAWHPMSVNAILDMSMLANYQVLYKFKGVASHAASAPDKGRSALDAVELMNVGVNFLREHVIQEARIHYAITNSGGFSPNVVQPYAEVLYLIRAPRTPQVEEIYQRVNKIARGAALMTETDLEIQFIKACANVIPNKTLSKTLYDNLTELDLPAYTQDELAFAREIAKTSPGSASSDIGRYLSAHPADMKRCLERLEGKAMCDIVLPFYFDDPDRILAGSSDVGDVSWIVPTGQVVTACYSLGTPEHSWQLVSQVKTSVGHKGMILAAKAMAGGAADALESPEMIKNAKAELANRLGGKTYRSAIPPDVMPRAINKI